MCKYCVRHDTYVAGIHTNQILFVQVIISSIDKKYITNVTPYIYVSNILIKSILAPQRMHTHFEDQPDNVVSDGQTFVLRSIRDVEKHVISLEKHNKSYKLVIYIAAILY